MFEAILLYIHRWMANTSTPLMLSVSHAPIGYISKCFSIIVFLYVTVTTVTQHTYMEFKTPVSVTNPYLGSAGYKAAYTSTAANSTPAYCANPDYDYNYGGGWNYAPNGCRATGGSSAELFQKSPGRASFVSFYQESQLEHSGAYAAAPTLSYFYPHIDELVLYIDHTMSAEWAGIKETNVRTTVRGVAGEVLHFANGETPHAKLGDFLAMAGISLDDENKNSGGLGVAEGSGNKGWPRYRLTGVALQFEMIYKNTDSSRPRDFTPYLEIVVSLATAKQWNGKGPRIMTLPQIDGRWKLVERYEYDVSVFFKTAGGIGTISAFSGIYSFLIVLAGGMLTLILSEILSGILIHRYFDKKTYTENNWATLTKLTFEGFKTGELQKAAMALGGGARTLALGFKPVGPSSAEYAVGGFETQANHKTEATLGGLVDKSFKRSKSVVYIGDL